MSFFAYYMGPPQVSFFWAPPQVSFFADCMGAPLRSVSSLTMWGPLDKLLCILYGGPLRSVSLLSIGGPLRSVSSHTIWGPLAQISFFAYYMGAPSSDQFLRLLIGGPQFSFSLNFFYI